MDRENVAHVHSVEYYSAIKSKLMSLAGKWMELESTKLHTKEDSKDKYRVSVLYGFQGKADDMNIIGQQRRGNAWGTGKGKIKGIQEAVLCWILEASDYISSNALSTPLPVLPCDSKVVEAAHV